MSAYDVLQRGTAMPAMPLAITSERRFDERRQRALVRYYAAAGAGGLAVGVHSTQFAIRDPQHNLLRPVLELAAEELTRADDGRSEPLVRVAGICGATRQAVAEATLATELGYHVGLLSLASLRGASHDALIAHCRAVAEVMPVMGFYLQPAVGGIELPVEFWRSLAEIDRVVAIKIAAFDRYRTLDVVRAVAESGRDDLALYTGNDDNIVLDLLTPYRFDVNGQQVERRMVGGLLGHWAVWTRAAVGLFHECRRVAQTGGPIPPELIALAPQVTDCNAVLFDAAHEFHGCLPGIHQVLHRQGLLDNIFCLDPAEILSPGQAAEISRVAGAYPHLTDDAFVAEHLAGWLE